MAVTGDIFKSLTFDGESSRDYGVYITGQAVYNAPERDVEMVTIPGRNGAFALDKGRFENIEVTYPAGVFANTDTEFAKAISDFRNMLCSRQGYCRLTDEYNPDEYRLAVYKSGLEVDPVQLKAGQFDITFECKPQRYLTSGEEKKVLGTWGDTETKTGEIVELENDGSLAVKSAEVALEPQQDTSGGVPSPSHICPITGASAVEIYADGKYGGEIEWNQLAKELSADNWNTEGGVTATYSDGVATVSSATANNGIRTNTTVPVHNGHKYLAKFGVNGTAGNVVRMVVSSSQLILDYTIQQSNVWETAKAIFSNTSDVNTLLYMYCRNVTYTNLKLTKPQIFDLTAMFGAGNEPATVAEFEALFPKDYYVYNAGEKTCVSAVNGDPYEHTTISLGTTVYGGSVDVVSGTGTDNCGGLLTFDGSNTSVWSNIATSAQGVTRAYTLPLYAGRTIVASDAYRISTEYNTEIGIVGLSNDGRLIMTSSFFQGKTFAEFKTLMASNPFNVLMTLATPTTLSLTPTTVNLIEGTNYVFSPQGEITVEYGTGPNFIVNPTLFGCGPLIEAKGYGDISFNGYTIKLANGAIGTVNLWQETRGGTFNGSITKTFVTGQFEPTDTFSFTVTHMFTLFEDNPSITNTNANAVNDFRDNNDGSVTYWIDLPCTFTVGTTGQITNTSTYDFGYGKKLIADMDVSYDSTTGTVVYTVATTTQGQPSIAGTMHGFYIGECNAVSTLNRLGDPTYIDCDLGEAYKINGGDVVSLNSFVDLGSKLPELVPGINEFTVSNTFTEVAVVPRWWKI